MKKLLQLLFLLISIHVFGQSPSVINYQGVVRDQTGAPIANQLVSLEFVILQGPSPGTSVFNEVQSVTTNSFGLFSVQIGGITSLNSVNFSSGTYSLQVNLDASGGNNYIAMGDPQLLSSVPFALHANSVPATYSNNVLTIGTNNTFTLSTPSVANPTIQGSGAAVVSPSTGLDFTVSVPPTGITISSTLGVATVSATGTNSYNINIPPTDITVTSTLGVPSASLSGPNAYNINIPVTPTTGLVSSGSALTTTLGVNSYSINVPPTDITISSSVGVAGVSSPGTNSFNINIPVASTTSLQSTGAAATTTLSTNNYSIHVPLTSVNVTTLAGTASVSSAGTNSFTINLPPPIPYTNGTGISITSGSVINNTLPDVPIVITGTNGVTVTNAYPNFTIFPPPVSLSGAGIVTVSAGPSFVIGAPSPTFTSAGPSSIGGTYPNLTITSPTTPSVSATGIATVSAGPNYLVGVQSPTYTSIGSTSITGTYPNLTITSPTNPTVSAAGIATVSAGPNYIVGVQTPTYTSAGPASVTGTYPNLTLTSPATPTVSAAGIVTVSAGPNYLVGVQSPSYTSVGPSSITGTYPNLTLTSPVTPTVSAAGIATVSAGPNYIVGVPQPTFAYSNSTGSLTSGTSSAYVTPNLTYSSGVLTSGPTSNSIAINSGTNALWSTLGNSATNSTVNFIGTTDNVNLSFRANNARAGGIFLANQSVYFGEQAGPLAANNGTWNVGVGQYALFNVTTGSENAGFGSWALRDVSSGAANVGIGSEALENTTTGNNNIGVGYQSGYSNLSGTGNVFLGHSAGYYETGSNKLYIANSSTSVTPLIYGDFSTGNVSIGTATANQRLNVDGNIALENAAAAAAPNRIIGFPVASSGNHGNLTIQAKSQVLSGIAYLGGNLVLAAGDFNLSGATGSNGGNVIVRAGRNVFDGSGGGDILFQAAGAAFTERMRISGVSGYVGIGTTAQYKLHVNTDNSPWAFAMTSTNPGNASVGFRMINNNAVLWQVVNGGTGNGLGFVNGELYFESAGARDFILMNNNSSETFRVTGGGNVGIGNSVPNAPLQFGNTIVNRKIVLWEGANNDHQFYGLGINGGTLRYQVDATSAAHVFFAGTGAASSNEIFRINGTGHIRMGNETGTGQPATYPAGGAGLIIRRIFSSNQAIGQVVARTDQMTFERDGTAGGFRITNTGGSGNEVCNCTGVNSAGAAVNRAMNNLIVGTTVVYSDAQAIVFLHCLFGDPFNAGHMTEVSLTRQFADWFWVGTVTTTQNQ